MPFKTETNEIKVFAKEELMMKANGATHDYYSVKDATELLFSITISASMENPYEQDTKTELRGTLKEAISHAMSRWSGDWDGLKNHNAYRICIKFDFNEIELPIEFYEETIDECWEENRDLVGQRNTST